jgi:hypothetical protein
MILCLIFQCFAANFYEHFEIIDFSRDECFPTSRLYPVLSEGVTPFCYNHQEFSKVKKEFESLLTTVGYVTRPEAVATFLKDFSTQIFVPKAAMLFHR